RGFERVLEILCVGEVEEAERGERHRQREGTALERPQTAERIHPPKDEPVARYEAVQPDQAGGGRLPERREVDVVDGSVAEVPPAADALAIGQEPDGAVDLG